MNTEAIICAITGPSGALKIRGRAVEQLGARERMEFWRSRLGLAFPVFVADHPILANTSDMGRSHMRVAAGGALATLPA